MKNFRKAIAMLLAAAMLFALAACGSTSSVNSEDVLAAIEADKQVVKELLEGIEAEELSLPLSEEIYDISVWYYGATPEDYDQKNYTVVQELEDRTNVRVTYTFAETEEELQLMLVSGDYCDILVFNGKVEYPGGIAQGVEDGVILDMTEYIARYMPNYDAMRKSDEATYLDTITDSGRSYAVYSLETYQGELMAEPQSTGLMVRSDLLAEWGMDEVPSTLEEWHDAFALAKENGASTIFVLGADGGYNTSGLFVTACGAFAEWYVKDGVVGFGLTEEAYANYVETMREWYSEGIIYSDFYSNTSNAATALANGDTIATFHGYRFTANGLYTIGFSTDPDIWMQAVANPVAEEGDTPIYLNGTSAAGNPVFVTTSCENPELVAKWLDYQFTKEGILLCWYGIEGISYESDENGTPTAFTDVIMNNPDGMTKEEAVSYYQNFNLGAYEWGYTSLMLDESVFDALLIWADQDFSYSYPDAATMTSDESFDFAVKENDIITAMAEATVKAITGQITMEQFREEQQDAADMGIDELIAVKQAAYDRYISRGT